MDNFELIENYLKGKLEGEALKAFQSRLASDSDFASQVEEHKAVQDIVFMKGMLETREKLNAIRKTKTGKNSGGNTNLFWKGGMLAIALLIFIGGSYLLVDNKKTSDNAPAQSPVYTSDTLTNSYKPQESVHTEKIPSSKNTKIIVDKEENKNLPYINSDTVPSVTKIDPLIDPENLPVRKTDEPITINKKPLCESIHIKVDISTEESCTNKNNGTLTIGKVSEGTAPYQFSINDSEFSSIKFYNNLESGSHKLIIKDAHGCLGMFGAKVGSKSCDEKNNIFSPDQGETWKFPVPEGSNCKIQILDAAGITVYETPIINGYPSEWDGTGNKIPYTKAGAYLYHIHCSDGSQKQGTVTIIR